MYKRFFKRVIDIILSLCLLFIVWPFLLLAIFFLYFANKGAGVFFTQERPGKNAKTFKVIKFKTMTDERDTDGKLLPDDKRLTKTGRVVRSLSIDELPQLFNVLKGDMALIGPRPLLPKYLPLYSSEQFRRHEVRPGITGWAQVMVEIIYLGGKIRIGCVVCGSLFISFGFENYFSDYKKGTLSRRYF